MNLRKFRRDKSGQVIVITGLLVALLLLSTAIFVMETEKDVPSGNNEESNAFTSYEQSTRSTLISALAEVTDGGGGESTLISDLNMLSSVISSDSYQSIVSMNYSILNVAPYTDGVWVSWGTNGQGISSDYVSFAFNSMDTSTSSAAAYAENVSSQIAINGRYSLISSNNNQVNLQVNVLNEGKPALAQNFTFSYADGTSFPLSWMEAGSPSLTDYGNGTYAVAFTAATIQPNDPIVASVICQDQRGITVGANVTCTNGS